MSASDASPSDGSSGGKSDAGVNCPVSCACMGSDACTFVGGSGSLITCKGQSDCYVTCPSGSCTVNCADDADCYVTGANVMCVETGNSTCHRM